MRTEEAIRILERLQEPDLTEGTLTLEAWTALEMAINSLRRDDQAIEPCPLCGEPAHLAFDRHKELPWTVVCNSCGCNIYGRETPERAISLWNRRKGA